MTVSQHTKQTPPLLDSSDQQNFLNSHETLVYEDTFGTLMKGRKFQFSPLRNQAQLHNRITNEANFYNDYYKNMDRIKCLLSEFFPRKLLLKFFNLIVNTRSKISITTPSGKIISKMYPKFWVQTDEDRVTLLTSFYSLFLRSQNKLLSDQVTDEINSFTGFSITPKDISYWYKHIRRYTPKFYESLSINDIDLFDGDSRGLLGCLKDKFKELVLEPKLLSYRSQIFFKSMEILRDFIRHPLFKLQKCNGFPSTSYAIIQEAYFIISGKKGTPFNLSDKDKNYISHRCSILRTKLQELSFIDYIVEKITSNKSFFQENCELILERAMQIIISLLSSHKNKRKESLLEVKTRLGKEDFANKIIQLAFQKNN